jgi:hypothetical protein
MTMTAPDVWHVKLENGEVRSLTLDELDAAYKDGWIRGRTPVLAAGAIKWSPLRDVAGLDPSGPWEAMPESVAPQAIDIDFGSDHALASSEIPPELRPKKRAGKIFGLMIALAAIGGIGFAATRAGVVMTAKSFVTSHIPGKSAPAKMEAPKAAAAPAPPPPVVAAPPPAPSPEPAAAAAPVATMNVGALPSASPKKKGPKRR